MTHLSNRPLKPGVRQNPPGQYHDTEYVPGDSRCYKNRQRNQCRFNRLNLNHCNRGDDEEIRNEAADLLYHLLVMLRASGVPLADVVRTLQARHA